MYSSTAVETARDTIRNTHSIIVLDSDHEKESRSLEHDDGAIEQIITHTEDSAEEQGTDMEDHNYSLNLFSNIELNMVTPPMLCYCPVAVISLSMLQNQMYSVLVIMNQILH